jgi:DNA-binding transcriptional MerR regulator
MDAVFVTTSRAARIANVSADTIRHWARTGVLPPAVTAEGGLRLFLADAVRQAAALRARRTAKADVTVRTQAPAASRQAQRRG